MNFRVVIPARYASQRLPGKPLLPINGQPMIWHVYQRALQSQATEVVIATDDQRIADAALAFAAKLCMTSAKHKSGTDRIAEVAQTYAWDDEDIVVNLQGDEPEMPSILLDQVAQALMDQPQAAVATLAVPITQTEEVFDSNVVKVVTNQQGFALYFSRAAIPWKRGVFEQQQPQAEGLLRHLGIYAYRVGFLRRFIQWQPAFIEQQESLEQLRALWHGELIAVDIAKEVPPPGIDTQEDYQRLVAALQ
jgi:3-deoxy-manno-octulosonate cytidylyltransferase (CMP-KDO synthetase)